MAFANGAVGNVGGVFSKMPGACLLAPGQKKGRGSGGLPIPGEKEAGSVKELHSGEVEDIGSFSDYFCSLKPMLSKWKLMPGLGAAMPALDRCWNW